MRRHVDTTLDENSKPALTVKNSMSRPVHRPVEAYTTTVVTTSIGNGLGGKARGRETCLRRHIGTQNIRFPRIARGPACVFAFQFCEEPAFEHCSGAVMFSILERDGAGFLNPSAAQQGYRSDH